MLKYLLSCCLKKPVQPTSLICETCMEPAATKKKCCNGSFCDHCYTKNKACPRCKTATRIEKMTGATYVLPLFNENEECRICLDPGIKRKCCGNYYCDDCFFKLAKCRSCETPVEASAFSMRSWSRAYIITILIGWGVTLFVILLMVIVVGTLTLNTLSEPVGINGFHCSGFFRTCDFNVCIETPVNSTTGVDTLPPNNKWRPCDLNTQNKLKAAACIFDTSLYTASNSLLGYDVCSEQYNDGVFLFEDSFEYWENSTSPLSNRMVSGKWSKVQNGIVSSFCGSGTEGGEKALVFYGEASRFATTSDLDMRRGGRIEGYMFLAPLSFDTRPNCRASFSGVVTVQYSIDGGTVWVDMKSFEPNAYRQENFFTISIELPSEAFSSSTRFRFIQFQFEIDRDNWALDNIRVLSYLPKYWESSEAFQQTIEESNKGSQFAQCCFDTDSCRNRLTENEALECRNVPGFDSRTFSLRQAELWVLMAAALGLLKFLYVTVQDFLIKRRLPFQDEIEEMLLLDFIRSRIPARYRLKKGLDDFVNNVHRAARLNEEHRMNLNDEGGEGEVRVRTADEQEAERAKKADRQKRQLKKKIRQLRRDGQPAAKEEMLLEDITALEDANGHTSQVFNISIDPAKQKSTTELPSELDALKRINLTLLRIPFNNNRSIAWTHGFASALFSMFALAFVFRISITDYYTIKAAVKPFGTNESDFIITSFDMNFFAFVCDLKEIFYLVRYVVPLRKSWVPLITIDKTDDVHALFIGQYTIDLDCIQESHVFSLAFIYGCAVAYFFAGIPFCLLLLILREQNLEYTTMQYLVPIIGVIIFLRVILGPAFVIKIGFCLKYLFDAHFDTREKMGIAMKSSKVRNSSFVAAVSLSAMGVFIGSAFVVEYAGAIFGILVVIGLIYGAFAGCIHSLPIRPWIVLTTLERGTWLHLKKKQRCPCIYWWSFCTDVHVNEELCIVFPEDDVKFFSVLKSVSGA